MMPAGKSVSVVAALGQVLASIRLTVALLLLLAVTSVFGTLIPQGGSPSDYLRQYGEIGYHLLYAFDLLDMYRSWWFRGLAVLLTANIVVCTWERFPATWKAVAAGRLNLPAVRCEDQAALTFTADGAPEALKFAYEQYFKRHFRRFRTEDIGDGFRLIGEKGRWTRLAVTGVHSGVVILLAGALMYFGTLTEVPILQALIGSGMGQGPALVLLLAGPALSLSNMLMIGSAIGVKKTATFCGIIVILSTIAGMIYGAWVA
jgi:hypothetical protein